MHIYIYIYIMWTPMHITQSSSVLRNAYYTVRAPKLTCTCASEHDITGLNRGKRVCFLTSSSNSFVRHWASTWQYNYVMFACSQIIDWKYFAKNDWFHAWYIVAILQLLTELSILRPERRFKLQKILSDASIKNEVLNHIKVNGMHANDVSSLTEPWWPSSWTDVCVMRWHSLPFETLQWFLKSHKSDVYFLNCAQVSIRYAPAFRSTTSH